MLLATTEELKMYLPTHALDNIDSMTGFFDNSEHDFLMEKIGRPLYRVICEQYGNIADKDELIPPYNPQYFTCWHLLITLCQRVIVFNAFMRAADVNAVSINGSGINVVSTGDYDNAGQELIKAFKTQCNQEAHAAVNRLLVQLEEWAQDVQKEKEEPDVSKIIELWKKSRYYYLVGDLFISTATKFNEFVDIYDSREKFVSLLPDLRFCQDTMISPELGHDLCEHLLRGNQDGSLNDKEKTAVRLIQSALALAVESRSKLFKRPEAHDESIQAVKIFVDFISSNQDDFGDAVKYAPFYVSPVAYANGNMSEQNVFDRDNSSDALFATHLLI